MFLPQIIATIGSSVKKVDKFLYDSLLQNNITSLRYNLSKFNTAETLIPRLEEIEKFHSYFPALDFTVDVALPGKKPRIHLPKNLPYYDVAKGDDVLVEFYPIISRKADFYIDMSGVPENMKVGHRIYYADGECVFVVKSINTLSHSLVLQSLDTTRIYNRKSMSFGYIQNNMSSVSSIFKVLLQSSANTIILSFVENVNDIKIIQNIKGTEKFNFISKIETEKGIASVSEIQQLSNIMIARGDLLLNTNMYNLYNVQKQISSCITKPNCRIYFASGILSSLSRQSIPTQADIIDLTEIIRFNPYGIVLNYGVVANNLYTAVEVIRNTFVQYKNGDLRN